VSCDPLDDDVPIRMALGHNWEVRIARWWTPRGWRCKVTPINADGKDELGWEIPAEEMHGYLTACRHVRELVIARQCQL